MYQERKFSLLKKLIKQVIKNIVDYVIFHGHYDRNKVICTFYNWRFSWLLEFDHNICKYKAREKSSCDFVDILEKKNQIRPPYIYTFYEFRCVLKIFYNLYDL